jgi:hypothetical protein
LKRVLALTGLLVAVGFLAITMTYNFLSINVESLLVVFNQFTYIVTYVSLLVCLFTVIATFLWYTRVRKKISSPIKHSELSVAKLILATTILIILIQICAVILYPDFLYQVSFYLFLISSTMFVVRSVVTFVGAYLDKRRERRDSSSQITNETPLVSVIVPAYNEEEAIGKAVDALVKLSYANKEIIVVDDGPTDRTFEVAKKHAELAS